MPFFNLNIVRTTVVGGEAAGIDPLACALSGTLVEVLKFFFFDMDDIGTISLFERAFETDPSIVVFVGTTFKGFVRVNATRGLLVGGGGGVTGIDPSKSAASTDTTSTGSSLERCFKIYRCSIQKARIVTMIVVGTIMILVTKFQCVRPIDNEPLSL